MLVRGLTAALLAAQTSAQCVPALVSFGQPGGPSCPRPISTPADCLAATGHHPQLPSGAGLLNQTTGDRPAGCWWQRSNTQLFFNAPKANTSTPGCSEPFQCVCCSTVAPPPGACEYSQYQAALLLGGCGGGNGSLAVALSAGERVEVVTLVAGVAGATLEVDSQGGASLQISDENGTCVAGAGCGAAAECANSSHYCVAYQGMQLSYGGTGNSTWAAVAPPLSQALTFSLTGSGAATLRYTYGAGAAACALPAKLPGCRACGSYGGCGGGEVPQCNGSAVVTCNSAVAASAIATIRPNSITAGVATDVYLEGSNFSGGRAFWATHCSTPAPDFALPSSPWTISALVYEPALYKLCYRAPGGAAFVEQAGVNLTVLLPTSHYVINELLPPAKVFAGVNTTIPLNGNFQVGDLMAWVLAPDCTEVSAASLVSAPTGDEETKIIFRIFPFVGMYRVCYRAAGGSDLVEQLSARASLQVLEAPTVPLATCHIEMVSEGMPFDSTCVQPVQEVEACTAASLPFPNVTAAGPARQQWVNDRPYGCWWQRTDNGTVLFFNAEPDSGIGCKPNMTCLCCNTLATTTTTQFPCYPNIVASGAPFTGACSRPASSPSECARLAGLHPDIPVSAASPVVQERQDQPYGCRWQPLDAKIYFNTFLAPNNSGPSCSASSACICCSTQMPTTTTTSTSSSTRTTSTTQSTTTTSSATQSTTTTSSATQSTTTTSSTTQGTTTTSSTTTTRSSSTTTTSSSSRSTSTTTTRSSTASPSQSQSTTGIWASTSVTASRTETTTTSQTTSWLAATTTPTPATTATAAPPGGGTTAATTTAPVPGTTATAPPGGGTTVAVTTTSAATVAATTTATTSDGPTGGGTTTTAAGGGGAGTTTTAPTTTAAGPGTTTSPTTAAPGGATTLTSTTAATTQVATMTGTTGAASATSTAAPTTAPGTGGSTSTAAIGTTSSQDGGLSATSTSTPLSSTGTSTSTLTTTPSVAQKLVEVLRTGPCGSNGSDDAGSSELSPAASDALAVLRAMAANQSCAVYVQTPVASTLMQALTSQASQLSRGANATRQIAVAIGLLAQKISDPVGQAPLLLQMVQAMRAVVDGARAPPAPAGLSETDALEVVKAIAALRAVEGAAPTSTSEPLGVALQALAASVGQSVATLAAPGTTVNLVTPSLAVRLAVVRVSEAKSCGVRVGSLLFPASAFAKLLLKQPGGDSATGSAECQTIVVQETTWVRSNPFFWGPPGNGSVVEAGANVTVADVSQCGTAISLQSTVGAPCQVAVEESVAATAVPRCLRLDSAAQVWRPVGLGTGADGRPACASRDCTGTFAVLADAPTSPPPASLQAAPAIDQPATAALISGACVGVFLAGALAAFCTMRRRWRAAAARGEGQRRLKAVGPEKEAPDLEGCGGATHLLGASRRGLAAGGKAVRRELIAAVFDRLDRDRDGALSKSEVRRLADIFGYQGSEQAWDDEYLCLCAYLGCSRAGVGAAAFAALVDDTSAHGCFCSDWELRALAVVLDADGTTSTPFRSIWTSSAHQVLRRTRSDRFQAPAAPPPEATLEACKRQALLDAVFNALATATGGSPASSGRGRFRRLGERELLLLARFVGYTGTDETWTGEYKHACWHLGADPHVGLDRAEFGHLVDDRSKDGCFCTNADLRSLLLWLVGDAQSPVPTRPPRPTSDPPEAPSPDATRFI